MRDLRPPLFLHIYRLPTDSNNDFYAITVATGPYFQQSTASEPPLTSSAEKRVAEILLQARLAMASEQTQREQRVYNILSTASLESDRKNTIATEQQQRPGGGTGITMAPSTVDLGGHVVVNSSGCDGATNQQQLSVSVVF